MTNFGTYVNNTAYDFAPSLHLPRTSVLVAPIVMYEMEMPSALFSSCPIQAASLGCMWTVVLLVVGTLPTLFATALDRFLRLSPLSVLSLRRSWNELTARRKSNLNCIDFIRVLAILWVMANHIGSEGRIDVLERRPSAEQFKRNIHNHLFFGPVFGNSALGVEIFLLLSGLLASRSWLTSSLSPAQQCLGFATRSFRFLGHRWMRLFPSFAIFLWLATGCLVETVMPRYTATMVSSCGVAGVLSHMTFVGNWQSTPTCLGYLWYLSLDMQLYAVAPVFLYLLEKRPKTGFIVALSTVVVSCVLRALNCRAYGICNKSDVDIPFISYPDVDPATVANVYEGIWDMYARPYTKCGPFIIGLLLGYVTIKYSSENPPAVFRATFERIEKFISPHHFIDYNLRGRLYGGSAPVALIHVDCGQERLPFADAKAKLDTDGKAVAVGFVLGPAWSTHWFKVSFEVPDTWQDKEICLQWDSGSEAMVWTVDGSPIQGLSSNFNRTDVQLDDSLRNSQSLLVEVAANELFGAGNNGMIQPPDPNKTFPLNKAHIAVFNRHVYEVLMDFDILMGMAKLLPTTNQRHYEALYLGNHMWKLVLLNQFHDVLPGTSIADVYFDAKNIYRRVNASLLTAPDTLRSFINQPESVGDQRRLVNSLSWERTIELNGEFYRLAPSSIQSLEASKIQPDDQAGACQFGDYIVLENKYLRAQIDKIGRVVSLRLRTVSGEYAKFDCVAQDKCLNQFVIFDDVPLYWDAWDTMDYHVETRRAIDVSAVNEAGQTSATITSSGPTIAEVAFALRISDTSSLRQTIRLKADCPYLEFDTYVDWNEKHKFLKVEFAVGVRAAEAWYDIQFGHVKRPTHRNTSWDAAKYEVCGHKWTALTEFDHGVAVLNDCKYGHSCHENVMTMSLLRAAKADLWIRRRKRRLRVCRLTCAGRRPIAHLGRT
uniref:Glycoside hydrolase family 38 central domain-containing protein n=1 Tax=Plectus sambesii TaxID=2011161 RepID=A0A914UM73_9BILA